MDYKALVEKLYDLFRDFLALVGLLEKFDEIAGEAEDILNGSEAE